MISTLISKCFGSPWTYNKNKFYETSDCWSRDTLNFDFLKKGFGLVSRICVWFFKKNISQILFYQLTKFHCLIAFTSWDIWQYVYYKGLLSTLWRLNFEVYRNFLTKQFSYMTRNSEQKVKYLKNEKSWNKKVK